MDQLVTLDALALSDAIRRKKVSCREVMQAYLQHIEKVNPHVNAIVSLRPTEALLDEAERADQLLAQGRYLGWMHGMPQAPKDLASCKGLPTSKGSPLSAMEPDLSDTTCIARVREAGAIFIGKTNVSEFGLGSNSYNPVFGVTRNAYDFSRIAGGSSGGAAAALAMRMLPVADGSDMMGSLRNPAAFNNVYGFRPTQGRVPYGSGGELFLQQLSTEGPMGRTVADVARLFATQAGYDRRCPLSNDTDVTGEVAQLKRDFKGTRIGWLGNYDGYLPIEKEVMVLCEAALSDFTDIGCTVEQCQPDYPMEKLWETWLIHRHWLVGANLNAYFANPAQRGLLKPEAQWEVESGLNLKGIDIFRASVARSDWYRAIHQLFEQYDYLLLPSAQMFAFDAATTWPRNIAGREMDTYHRWMEVVIGPTLAGLPAMSVPVGFGTNGLPMGMQIIGPSRDDIGVLQLAHALEALRPWVSQAPLAVVDALNR
ncbi:amidase [Herbaspirillum rubrisubalbicans]|uniref:Amidase n=1 Tax=Herbaspirillum rubrisubalbicans TaxID=80842 RepID=A0AAD0UE92_9BURK|nr:amidase [Herbaspirillum rubrisubalbicans]ALU87958.1 amidase family protein [Herbaspirillum rubrisubalbicans M1]AYR26907.1 amidase [Herbaspirillum rubrisubalbicans]